MKKFTTIITLVLVVFSFNTEARRRKSSQFKIQKLGANKIRITGMKLGEVAWKTVGKILSPIFQTLFSITGDRRVLSVTVIELVDAHEYKNTRRFSSKDNALNGGLSTARGQSSFSVMRKFVNLHKISINTASVRCSEVNGNCRGVEISWRRMPLCTVEEFKAAVKVTFRDDGISKSRLQVVTETKLPKAMDKVKLFFDHRYDQDGKPLETDHKCMLLVDVKKQVVAKTPYSCPSCPAGHIRPAHKKGICPMCVKVKTAEKKVEKPISCPVCPKGQLRPHSNDSSICLDCVDVEPSTPKKKKGTSLKDSAKKIKLAGAVGITNSKICPTAKQQVQIGAEVSVGINKYIRVLSGFQSVQAIVLSGGKLVEKRIPLGILGLELSFSLKDLGTTGPLSSLRFGVTAKMMMNTSVQLPAVGAFIRIPFKNGWYIQGGVERISFKTISALDSPDDQSSASSWGVGLSIGFRF